MSPITAASKAVRSSADRHVASIANPYPGLRPFERSEEAIFFGRDRMIDDVIDRVAKSHLVLVHGASGCGKSSLIRAGVLAKLERMHILRDICWHTAIMRPGNSPMWHFARALVEALRPRTENEPDVQTVRRVRLHLNQGLSGLTQALEFLDLGKSDRLCILVDQFEELFQYADEGGLDEAAQFVRLLLAIREPARGEERPGNLAIVLTMRSDYLGDCTRFDRLAEAVNATQYLVVPMGHEELVDVICQPAMLPEFGGTVDLDVAEALIRDTQRDPDQLPLIQHALAYMWLRGRANDPDAPVHITLADYRDEKVQNAANALSNHADEALAELETRDRRLRKVTEHVFRALTETDAAGRAIRRRMPKPTLLAEAAADEKDVDAVIETFARPERSFIYLAEHPDPDRPAIVDITHEALIRNWRQLSDHTLDGNGQPRGWVPREAADRRAWLTLVDTASGLERGQRVFLPKDVLEERKQWLKWVRPNPAWAERHGGGFDLVTRLFAASEKKIEEDARREKERREAEERARLAEVKAAKERARVAELKLAAEKRAAEVEAAQKRARIAEFEAEIAERQAAQERRLFRRTLWLAAGAFVLAVMAAGFGWLAYEQREAAEKARVLAEEKRDAAERAQVVARVREAAADTQRKLAQNLALQEEAATRRARARLIEALDKDTLLRTSLAKQQLEAGWPRAALRLALSALPRDANDMRRYLPEAGQALVRAIAETPTFEVIGDDAGPVNAVAFSPDGRHIVTCSRDGIARLLDVATGEQIVVFKSDEVPALGAALSPDGTRVLTGSDDGTARLWHATAGKQLLVLEGHEAGVDSVAFSPDGTRILTGSEDGTARLWNATTGEQLSVLKGHEADVVSLAFSPDGTRVLTGSGDDTARLWNATTGEQLSVLKGHEDRVWSVAFSPDGVRILTGSGDHTARLWDATTGLQLTVLRSHEGSVYSVAFSPDGARILTGSGDNTARLWDAETGNLLKVLDGHGGAVRSAAFDPAGGRVATAGEYDGVRLWQIDPMASRTIVALDESFSIYRAVPSPDGRDIVTGSHDGIARLWDAATGEQRRMFEGHEGTVYTVAFSPDGERILTGSADETARIWDVATGEQLRVFEGHEGSVFSVAFSPDGARILTGSADNTARLWDAETGKQIVAFQGHESGVYFASFGPKAEMVVTASSDGTVRLWDTASEKQQRHFAPNVGEAYTALMDPGGDRLAATFKDGLIRVWSLEGETPAVSFVASDYEAFGLVWADQRVLYTTGFDGSVRAFDVAAQRPLAYDPLPDEFLFWPAIMPTDGSILVPAGNGRVYAVPSMADRTWEDVVEHALELAGAPRPTEEDMRRIELLRALEKTEAVARER